MQVAPNRHAWFALSPNWRITCHTAISGQGLYIRLGPLLILVRPKGEGIA